MLKLAMMSVLFVSLGVPLLAARSKHPRRALRQMLVLTALFNLAYVIAIMVVIPSLRG